MMRWALSSICVALLLAGCSFVVTVDDASYRVSVRPLVDMLKTIAPFVRPRQLVEWRTTGQWRSVSRGRGRK